jgi:hypothetical protein
MKQKLIVITVRTDPFLPLNTDCNGKPFDSLGEK